MRIHGRLLLLAGFLGFVISCDGPKNPTAPGVPTDPSKVISDGAHGGNKDFFFLPPMVADPSHDPNFEPGQFNATLAPNLTVEICQLQASPVDALGQPVVTDCVSGPPKTKFPAGTVTLQNPPDGFYQVVWHVGESGLDVTKFYRIKVLVQGSTVPFGVADVDPVASMKELRNARTGEIIPLNDNSTLPIKFRIEHGGGSTLCGDAAKCISTTITNSSTTGSQSVTLEGGAGSIAGARFPNGWLPTTGPQSVVVTVAQITTAGGGSTTADATACHQGLALEQFKGCFSFTTTPRLQPINENGDQFATPVTVAVCYELDGSGDPREKFAELWASGPNEPAHPLDDASDAGLLGAGSRNCTTTAPVITSTSSNPLVQFASAGWRNLKGGLGRVFGIKTAYAIDLGLGGVATAFSHVSPVLSATIQGYTSTSLALGAGATTTSTVRIVGNNHHATHAQNIGLGGLPVTFTLAPGNGSLVPLSGGGTGGNQLTVSTNTNPIDGSATSGGGFAPVNWTMPTPTAPGTYTYTLTATGPALGGPVTFTSTVTVAPTINLASVQGTWLNDNASTGESPEVDIAVTGNTASVHGFGACVPSNCDWGTTTADASQWNTQHKLTAVWNFGYELLTQTITYVSATQVSIVNFHDFQPPDTRTDFTSSAETFTKQTVPLSAIVTGWFSFTNTNVRSVNFVFNTGNSVGAYPSGNCDDPQNPTAICTWDPTTVDTSRWNAEQIVTFVVDRNFATKSVTAHWISANQIHVSTVTHFTDESGRADYTTEEDLILNT